MSVAKNATSAATASGCSTGPSRVPASSSVELRGFAAGGAGGRAAATSPSMPSTSAS